MPLCRFIKSRNRQHLGYTLKPNHLTDMTEKEVEREKGLLKANHEALIGGAMFHVPLGDENRDPPETLDWRQRGKCDLSLLKCIGRFRFHGWWNNCLVTQQQQQQPEEMRE